MSKDERNVIKEMEGGDEVGKYLLQVRGETFRESELGWRNLVFIPFNTYWLVLVTMASIYQHFMDSQFLLFRGTSSDIYKYGNITVWVIFLVDLATSIIHRLWERVNRSRRFVPKSWFLILVDIVCAHPILLFYFLYFQGDSIRLVPFLKWFVIVIDQIRLYRVFVLYAFLMAKIDLNQQLVHMIFYNLFIIILTDVFTVWWNLVESPSDNVMKRYPDRYEEIHIFLGHFLYGSPINDYYPRNELNVFLLLLPTLLWYCFNRLYVITLLMVFLKKLNHQFSYRATLEVADIHLRNIGIKKKVREDFLNFYYTLWELWWGITSAHSLDELPLSMRKEIYVDISWDAIQHSRTLRFQGINFKRDLALSIQSVMYRPNDYVFYYNDLKCSMLYLVSGTVQVMSAHDSTCPLLTLSRGTILGGGSIIISSICNVAVRSSSYCEMHVLQSPQLFSVALLYPWEQRYMHFRAFDRLQDVYTMNKVEKLFKARKNMYDQIFQEPDLKCITWMKDRWKLINSLNAATSAEVKEIVKEIPVFEVFTSRYLDLYVISEDEGLELKKNRFCLEAMWPFVMEPECDFLRFWNGFILVLVCSDSILLPYYAAHEFDLPYFVEHFSIFNQLMFMLDTYFNLITAIKQKDLIILTAKEIVKYRIKTIGFAVDLVSALPLGIFTRLVSDQIKVGIYWDLLRLFKTWRAMKILTEMESNLKNPATLPWLRHAIVYIILIYWSSNMMYYISCPRPGPCKLDGWVSLGKQMLHTSMTGVLCFQSYLAISLYYVMSSTHQINSSKIYTDSSTEKWVICILTAFIQTYMIYFTAHVIAVDQLADMLQISFSSLIKNTINFMKQRNMPKRLSEELSEYLNLQWSHDRAHEYLLQNKLFHDAPEKLYAELSNYFIDVLKSYKIFQGDSEDTKYMIDKLAEKARIVMLPKHFVICSAGRRASCLTILRKGYCRMISHLKSDVATCPDGKLIGAGAIFPLVEISSKTASVLTVYTVTNCECIVIDEPDFIRAWEASENAPTQKALSSRNARLVVEKLRREIQPNFTPIIPDAQETSFIKRKIFFCDKENLLRVALHLMFPKYCFNPLGSFLFYWEMTRFILIPLSTNFFILYYIILYPLYPQSSFVLSCCFDTVSLVDVLFRFNTGYYNKDGVFVSDTCLLVLHYLVSSFIIDFIGAFPWQAMLKVKKVVDLPWLILCIFKIFPIYRVIRFNMILAKRGKLLMTHHIYTFLVLFITIVNFMTCCILLHSCFVEYADNKYLRIYCKQMLVMNTSFQYDSIWDVFMISLGRFIGSVLKMKSDIIKASNTFGMYIVMCFGGIMNLMQILFVVKCCRWSVSGLRDYTLFKQNVDTLDVYLKKNLPDSKIRRGIQDHFEFYWKNRMPEEVSAMLIKVHPALRVRVLGKLYFDQLMMVSFLKNAKHYLLRALAQEVKEMYVMKGQAIIEEFEISKSIYLIWQGEVVVTVARISPVVLGKGCVFGCLSYLGYTKHVFSFEALKNTALLKIDSPMFFSVLKDDVEIYTNFVKLCLPSREYIVSGEEITVQESAIDLSEIEETHVTTTSSSTYVLMYLIVTYLVTYLTIIILCLFLLFGPTSYIMYSLLIVDLITLWKIFTQLSLPYVDPKTGLIVKNKKLIRKRYVKTKDFVIDVITFLPFIGIPWLLIIKLLRIYEAVVRINERRNSFHSKDWEVWVHSLMSFLMISFVLAVIWDYTLAFDMKIYRHNTFDQQNPSIEFPSSGRERFLYSILFTTVLLTQTGRLHSLKYPTRKSEIALATCISIISVIILGLFLGRLSYFVEKVTWVKRGYENKMQRQWQYLKLRELSDCILKSLREHGEQLWHYNRGQYFPTALNVLPYPLKKKVMYGLFGRHLEKSYLFKYTHIEFIKNLCARFQMVVFFPGETIVMEGDVDGTMYFIHSGEVDVLKIVGKDEEELVGILTVEQIFGFCQGLYDCRPHPKTYKARSTCEILQLRREDWTDLMLFYDSQTLTVYHRASKLPYEFTIYKDYL